MGMFTLASEAIAWMFKVYDQKYGAYGEVRVRKLQEDIVDLMNDLAAITQERDRLSREVAALKSKISILETALENSKKMTSLMTFMRNIKVSTGGENPF